MTTSGCYDNSNLDKTCLIWNFLLLLKVKSYDNAAQTNDQPSLIPPSTPLISYFLPWTFQLYITELLAGVYRLFELVVLSIISEPLNKC